MHILSKIFHKAEETASWIPNTNDESAGKAKKIMDKMGSCTCDKKCCELFHLRNKNTYCINPASVPAEDDVISNKEKYEWTVASKYKEDPERLTVQTDRLGVGAFGEVALVSRRNEQHFLAAKVANPIKMGETKRQKDLSDPEDFRKEVIENRILDNVEVLEGLTPHENIITFDKERKLMLYAGFHLSVLMPSVSDKKEQAMKEAKQSFSGYEADFDEDYQSGDSILNEAGVGVQDLSVEENAHPIDLKEVNSPEVIKRVAKDIAKGLQHLHKNDIVHLDLKPDNLFVNRLYHVAIGDFGCAKKLTDDHVGVNGYGYLQYMPPELGETIVQGNDNYPRNDKLDIWSFGVTLYELITEEPFCTGQHVLLDSEKQLNFRAMSQDKKNVKRSVEAL